MSINHAHLRAFHAVATHGSFTRAAASLHVTQPTISDQIKALEGRYRVRLFERHSRRIEITALGKALLEITRRQFAAEVEAEQLLRSARELVHGRLRVAAGAPHLVVPLLGAFKRRHPGIEFTLHFGNTAAVLSSLFAATSDLAVLPDIGGDPRLHAVPIRRDRLAAFVGPDHPWTRRSSVRLSDIAGQPLVLRESGSKTRALFESVMRDAGLSLGEQLEIGSREGVLEAVAAGLGVGIVFRTELGHDSRLHALSIRHPGIEVTEFAACLPGSRESPAVKTFMELVRASPAP